MAAEATAAMVIEIAASNHGGSSSGEGVGNGEMNHYLRVRGSRPPRKACNRCDDPRGSRIANTISSKRPHHSAVVSTSQNNRATVCGSFLNTPQPHAPSTNERHPAPHAATSTSRIRWRMSRMYAALLTSSPCAPSGAAAVTTTTGTGDWRRRYVSGVRRMVARMQGGGASGSRG